MYDGWQTPCEVVAAMEAVQLAVQGQTHHAHLRIFMNFFSEKMCIIQIKIGKYYQFFCKLNVQAVLSLTSVIFFSFDKLLG